MNAATRRVTAPLSLIAVLILPNLAMAERSYKSLVPYGNTFSCSMCHTDAPDLNGFGDDFLSNGNKWSSALATKDSDGDGFANGVEVQDPNGTWVQGNADPGTAALATDPGDPADFPVAATSTPTLTPSPTSSPTPTASPSPSASISPTATATISPSLTATPSPSLTATPSPSLTASVSPSATATVSPSLTSTPNPTATQTAAPTATETTVPTATETAVPSPTETAAPTATETAVPSPTETAVPTATETASPSPTPSPTDVVVFTDPLQVFASLDSNQWESVSLPGVYTPPTFIEDGGLGFGIPTPGLCFGFWQTRSELDPLPAGLYRIRFTVAPSRAGENRLPELRFRAFQSDNSQSSLGIAAETILGNGYRAPVEIYWLSDGTSSWRLAMDILSFLPEVQGSATITNIETQLVN